jgi:transposase
MMGGASGSVWQPVAEQRRRRRSSTPSRSARPIPCHGPAAAGTPARRSTAASGTWQWTPWGCCWSCWSLRPACRTATPAGALLWRLRASHRSIRLVWADGGYAGKLVAWAACVLHLAVEIVRKRPGQSTFEVLPRRWVVERTLAWISKHRRCVRDYERLPAHHAAMATWAMVAVMTRRLARPHRPPSVQTTGLRQSAVMADKGGLTGWM